MATTIKGLSRAISTCPEGTSVKFPTVCSNNFAESMSYDISNVSTYSTEVQPLP